MKESDLADRFDKINLQLLDNGYYTFISGRAPELTTERINELFDNKIKNKN